MPDTVLAKPCPDPTFVLPPLTGGDLEFVNSVVSITEDKTVAG